MSFFGKNLSVEIFGESHAECIGIICKGIRAGEQIDRNELQAFLDLRKPGQNEFSTPRKEEDKVVFLSGVDENDCTDGNVLKAVIYNTNTRSSDYEKTVPRPAHADYPAYIKHGSIPAGGGRYSGRLTAATCIIGGIALQILKRHGITIDAHILALHGVVDEKFDPLGSTATSYHKKPFPVINDECGEKMKAEIRAAKASGDSVGGIIECRAIGLPIGLGDGIFDGIDGHIAQAIFGIPAVKGIEFGAGFAASGMLGSENNDEYYFDGGVKTYSNNAGGVLGGMTSGMPLIFTAAFKPTPSIFKEQRSVDLKTMENTVLKINGRHDPSIVQRAVAPVIAATALAIFDLWEEA